MLVWLFNEFFQLLFEAFFLLFERDTAHDESQFPELMDTFYVVRPLKYSVDFKDMY
jgi:hypothetical protein